MMTHDTSLSLSVSGAGSSVKAVRCDVCKKTFKNNSALGCHMKMHSHRKYYSCPMCSEDFDRQVELREHAVLHITNGVYPCAFCHKAFPNLRKDYIHFPLPSYMIV